MPYSDTAVSAGATPSDEVATVRRRTITLESLTPPRHYGSSRRAYKQQLIAHRRERSLSLGPCMRLQFEDEQTVRYQIQEVLHAERITDDRARQHEIDTYAHLLPDGQHWKATLLIELPDAFERERELPRLNEAAHRLYIAVPHHTRIFAEANEDLADRHRTRPSAVHFLRFPFDAAAREAVREGAAVTLGCLHDEYDFRRLVPITTLALLRHDLGA